jgi:dolichyl-phosphate-mannose-protein mannosyltransferase
MTDPAAPATGIEGPQGRSWLSRRLVALSFAPLDGVLLALIVLGWFLRLHAFSFPDSLLFDEHHFVDNARRYLRHQPDMNDHPPLGKLLIAASILAFGDNPVAWRLPALGCGALIVIMGGVSGARLFRRRSAGWMVAALLSTDGFLISYSRVGLLDGYLAACAIVAVFVATLTFTRVTALAGGLIAGVASCIKFSGAAVLAPMLLAIGMSGITRRRKGVLMALVLAACPTTYCAVFAVGLRMADHPASIAEIARETFRLLVHHAGLTDMKNPLTSSWPTWILPARPIVLGHIRQTGAVRILSSIGNLAIWWAAMATAMGLMWTILVQGLAATLQPRRDPSRRGTGETRATAFLNEHGHAVLLVLAAAIAFLAPWILTHRDSYIYHFLPSYAVLVLLLGGVLDWYHRRRPLVVLTFVVLVLLVSAFYAPVWSFLATNEDAVARRLFLRTWM